MQYSVILTEIHNENHTLYEAHCTFVAHHTVQIKHLLFMY